MMPSYERSNRGIDGAKVYRFNDFVAVTFDKKGETIYLTAQQTHDLSLALLDGSRDINTASFVNSKLNQVRI